MDNTEQPNQNTQPEQAERLPQASQQASSPRKKVNAKKLLLPLLIILLLAVGAGAYYWRDKQPKTDQKNKQSEISSLQQKVSDLEKQLAEEKAKKAGPAQPTTTLPSTAELENIKAAISSGNTAALEGYMAPSVRVIIAASEGIGDRTPTQAIGDLAYLNAGTDPWNFALPASTLANYASGSYAQYFPSSALVGKSANKYVVSFTFNSSGKINGIFMAVNSDLL